MRPATKPWVNRCLALLSNSIEANLEPNELDWKVALSDDKQRLAEHLSAFANHQNGGFFVFGVNNAGKIVGVANSEIQKVATRLPNLCRDALEPPIHIDLAADSSFGPKVLMVYVRESASKPVHLRGKSIEYSYVRVGGTTRKASRSELATLLMNSRPPRWEELPAGRFESSSSALNALKCEPLFKMIERQLPSNDKGILDWLLQQKFVCEPTGADGWCITNLGAISAARDLEEFPSLARKAVRVIQYKGKNKAKTTQEQSGHLGYAIAFQRLMHYVTALLPQSEVIAEALRTRKTIYPDIALREIIANALIHQDFTVTGAGPMIELFDNRIEISNPGAPVPGIQLDRLIGAPPESRNEQLAKTFRQLKICEERGSGLIKAGLAVELYGLPPIKFERRGNSFKVTLFAPRTFAQMSPAERLDACYQHAVLKHLSSDVMTNTSLRRRLKMPEKQRSMVSVLIQEACSKNLIKAADPDNRSTKHAKYVPYWA